MSTQTIFITGATEGIGKIVALDLAIQKKTLLFLFMEEIKRSLIKQLMKLRKRAAIKT